MDQTAIKQELDTFISRSTKIMPIEHIILYGSFAKNIARRDSDIDLLVIGNFKKHNITDPTSLLYDTYADLQTRHLMHVVGINSEDYINRDDSITLESIRKTGKIIYSLQKT